jgi:hypothetical protein
VREGDNEVKTGFEELSTQTMEDDNDGSEEGDKTTTVRRKGMRVAT